MSDEARLRDAIAAERAELADVLDGLSPGEWEAPSLCDGWRVREVVAHMTMGFRYSTGRFLLEMLRAGGRFDRMADRCARRDAAALSIDELRAALADNVHHPWKPPGSGYAAALSHDVIHGLDITVPLGLDRHVPPPERLQRVIGSMTPKRLAYFGTDLDGVALRARDLGFVHGSGTSLYGDAQDLLLVLCGRKLPSGHLIGETASRFSSA